LSGYIPGPACEFLHFRGEASEKPTVESSLIAPPDAPCSGTASRWAAVGSSTDLDATTAGRQAARDALTQPDPRLVVVFSADSFDLHDLLRGVREVAGDIPLIGCSTAGEITSTRAGDASVVVMAIGGEGFRIATAAAEAIDGDLRDASARAAECLARVEGEHQVLLLLTDGLSGDQQEVVRGAYRAVGATIPLVGGCAGDGLKMQATYQFHGDRIMQNAVVAAAIASDAPMGIGVRHGWRRIGEPMLITGSESCVVQTLNDEPALDVYLDLLDAPEEVRTDPAAFTRFAMTHPLGLSRRSGEEVRFVAGADFEQRHIVCIAEVPQGGTTWIMQGDDDSVLAATEAACRDALIPLNGSQPVGLLAFDCIARRGVLGEDGVEREVARIAEVGAGAPVAGFYTYGEIARTHGMSGFHNQTLVVLALG
jgi:hypothetical protein